MCVVITGGDMNDFNCFSNQALSACGIVKVTNGGLSAGWRCEKVMMERVFAYAGWIFVINGRYKSDTGCDGVIQARGWSRKWFVWRSLRTAEST